MRLCHYAAMRLVLFDIDGTLITDGGAARHAYRSALAQIYGWEGDLTRYDFSGRTDPGARLKLGPAGLNPSFSFGAFGSDSAAREELPPIAVERASQINGHRFAGRDVVIIGDSIYDVRCGVPHGATTIAIASGKTPAEKLLAERPHHFFHSADSQ